jgi:hypothetical protein
MGKSAAIASASDDSIEPLLDSAYQSSRRKSCAAFYGALSLLLYSNCDTLARSILSSSRLFIVTIECMRHSDLIKAFLVIYIDRHFV